MSVVFGSLPWIWVKKFMGRDGKLWQLRKQFEAEAEDKEHKSFLGGPQSGWIALYNALIDADAKFWARDLRKTLKDDALENGAWEITGERYMDDVHMQSVTLNPNGTFTWKDWTIIPDYSGTEDGEEVHEVVEGLSAEEIVERAKMSG